MQKSKTPGDSRGKPTTLDEAVSRLGGKTRAIGDVEAVVRARQRRQREEGGQQLRVAAQHGVEQLENVERRLPPLLGRHLQYKVQSTKYKVQSIPHEKRV